MIKELVLFRHGKAEESGPFVNDANRELTGKGRADIITAAESLRRFLLLEQNLLLWSSPLLRASQTAELLAAEFNIATVSCFDFIATGDFGALARETEKQQLNGCLVVVGHEPYLGDWSQIISGCRLPFKKAAAAGFKMQSWLPPAGELQWFIQPNFPRRMTPDEAEL
jgi:phosphohistidine phosphatase